jgi:hypothetical protein
MKLENSRRSPSFAHFRSVSDRCFVHYSFFGGVNKNRMPRSKPVPVRREIDRFHFSASNAVEADDASQQEDGCEEVRDASQHHGTSQRRVRHVEDVVIKSNEFNSLRGWRVLGAKVVSPGCQHFTETKLELRDGSELGTWCTACANRGFTAFDSIGLQTGKAILDCIRNQMLKLTLSPTSEGQLILNTLVPAASVSLSSVVLRWLLGGVHTTGSHESVSVDELFSASAFLSEIAAAFRVAPGHETLRRALIDCGIRTELRAYQLQGVQWMYDGLVMGPVTEAEVELYLFGWIKLPCPANADRNVQATEKSNSSSSNGDSTTSLGSDMWYNTLTEAVHFGAAPVHLLPLAQPTVERERSLILADEMGVGKSLQIIALIALLKKKDTLSDSVPAISSVVVDGGDAPATAHGEPTAVHVKHGGSGDSRGDARHRSCLCGSSDDLSRRTHGEFAQLGWVQCSCCDTWLHAPCAGFYSAEALAACEVFTCLACTCLQTFTQPITTHTALIVMPNTLIAQWRAELLKHTAKVTFNNPTAREGLKVFIYPDEHTSGSSKTSSAGKGLADFGRLDPRTLAQYDIILLSFRGLQNGYHEANVDYTSARVQRSSYAIYPPPFLCLRYRLLVVDETQNIESPSGGSQVLNMACRIPSLYRVSVSGTPLGTGRLSDLHSLCQFLRIAPLDQRAAWNRLIERPVVPVPVQFRIHVLQSLFSALTLRRTKAMIREQLGLPQHSVITISLQFSTFEVRVAQLLLCFVCGVTSCLYREHCMKRSWASTATRC